MQESLREITLQEFEQMKNNFGYDEDKEEKEEQK